MKEFDEGIIDFINKNNLVGIKAGKDRQSFLDIWMITFENRVFARSWGLAERSWYNTFLIDNLGEIKCGEKIIQIVAIIPDDIELLKDKLSGAYLKKYDHGENSYYAHGIIKDEHIARTMEFVAY